VASRVAARQPPDKDRASRSRPLFRFQVSHDRPHDSRSRAPALIGIFCHKLRIVRISLARGLHDGVAEQVADPPAAQRIGLSAGDQRQTSRGVVLRKFGPALLAVPLTARLAGSRFVIKNFHMHGDAEGQQLDQGTLGIILVIQGELPSLVVVTMFGRLSQV